MSQRKQTAVYWQFWFSDRFTGARNPARLSTTDAIPSNPLRPLSLSFYHLRMSSNRRGFLRTTLGACWTGASLLEQSIFRATQARAQASSTPQPALFEIEKVADGGFAAIAKPVALTNSNAAIFENTDDLLIVDTHSKPAAVIALVSQIRREITLKPVRYIVNSHFHWDHTQGNHGYKRIAPSADIVASEPTRQLLSKLSDRKSTRLNSSHV